MSGTYSYEAIRSRLFTESGQEMLLKVWETAERLIKQAGAVRAQEAWGAVTGDSWMLLACLDRLVELGYLHEVEQTSRPAGQHRIFVAVTR